jgi:adenine-specific DNA methylase
MLRIPPRGIAIPHIEDRRSMTGISLPTGGYGVTAAEPTSKKRRGAYYTPRHLADFLVGWAIRQPTDRVLDPACGDAVFLESATARLEEFGVHPKDGQVAGVDLNPEAVADAKRVVPQAAIVEGDFFAHEPDGSRYEAVVGNPPYIRYHYFSGEVRSRALVRARAEGVKLSELASAWAPFVVHASAFLAPHGRLAFVLPAELLSTDYAAPVRAFLRRRFARIDIVTFEHRVFPNAMVDVVLMMAEGKGPGEVRVHRLPDARDLDSFMPDLAAPTSSDRWTHALLGERATRELEEIALTMKRLGEIAAVDIGVVTGANNYFVLTERQVQEEALVADDLRPLVARGHQLPGSKLTPDEWDKLRTDGKPVWLFAPGSFSGSASAYIAKGEQMGAHRAYKCRVRHPWWRIRIPAPPDLFLTYMSNHGVKLVANEAGVVSTNLLHQVRLTKGRESARFLALAWPNSATLLSTELEGRAYGGGVLKLETREAERVLVPCLTECMTEALARHEVEIDRLLSAGDLAAAADLVDPIVLASSELAERRVLRAAWQDLRNRRKRRTVAAKAVS